MLFYFQCLLPGWSVQQWPGITLQHETWESCLSEKEILSKSTARLVVTRAGGKERPMDEWVIHKSFFFYVWFLIYSSPLIFKLILFLLTQSPSQYLDLPTVRCLFIKCSIISVCSNIYHTIFVLKIKLHIILQECIIFHALVDLSGLSYFNNNQ